MSGRRGTAPAAAPDRRSSVPPDPPLPLNAGPRGLPSSRPASPRQQSSSVAWRPVAVADAARARIEVMVSVVMTGSESRRRLRRRSEKLKLLPFLPKRQRVAWRGWRKSPSDQHHAPGRRRRFYLAVHGRRVSVRFPHGSADMPWRSISGSFACWRISGGVETIRERGAQGLVVDPCRGLAQERPFATQILPQHRLCEETFTRWLNVLLGAESCVRTGSWRASRRPKSVVRTCRPTSATAPPRRSGRCTSRRSDGAE